MYKKYQQPGTVKTITADWKSIPWEEAESIYSQAADIAEETAKTLYIQQTRDKYPDADLKNLKVPNRIAIRRRAGNKALVEEFITRYKLDHFGINVVAQIVAHLATLPLTTVEGETVEGEILKEILNPTCISYDSEEFQSVYSISGLDFLKAHFNTPYMMGIYRFLMLDSRGAYLTKQYTGESRGYCALVPLILSAFKRYHNIPYSAWNRDQIKWVVNPELCSAMLYELPFEENENGVLNSVFLPEKLLELREFGLLWKSGKNMGTQRNSMYTHSLSGMQTTEFKDTPDLAQVMLTQIWCAHPENRTKYMVLSPNAWDCIPQPLISNNIFLKPVLDKHALDDSEPWAS
jgi:hypothetical protein